MNKNSEQGNVLFYILLGLVLLGVLTVAIRNSGGLEENIDREDYTLKAGQVQRYGQELSQAVNAVLGNGASETQIRFAHGSAAADYGTITTTPTNQVFSSAGGKANYQLPPDGVNDGSKWEFFATTRIPQVGSNRAELVAVLPNVTQGFCTIINKQLGFTTGTQPTDNTNGSTPDCVMGASTNRFTGTFLDSSPNLMDSTTFSRLPAMQGCVSCASGSTYNYFYVLLAR